MADARDRVLEICVDTAAGLDAAIKGGADRIELCAALGIGGLTSSHGFMRHAAQTSGIPVYALIRPRAGDFEYSRDEISMMETDIATARELGLKGIVIGATNADQRLDAPTLKRLIEAGGNLDVTLHRAFDMVKNPTEAIDVAIDLGITRILTSGCAKNVGLGLETIKALTHHANRRLSIMPGGGVTRELVPELLAIPGIYEIHASGSISVAEKTPLIDFGFATSERRQTDKAVVKGLKQALLHARIA